MKALTGALGVGVVVAGVAAGMLWRDLSAVRSQSTELRDRLLALQSAQVAASLSPDPLLGPAALAGPATTASPGSPQGATAPAATTGPAAARNASQAGNALMEGISKVLSSPEGRDIVLAQVRMMLPQQFPDLAQELGLSKAEEEKFFDMLARQQADLSGGVLGALGGGGMDQAAIQEMQRKAREQQQAQQAEINTFLGSKAPQWQEYQRTLPVRQQVNSLKTALGPDNPLTASQSRSLMTAISAEQERIRQDRRNAPRPAADNPQNRLEQQMQRQQEDNARLVSAASSHLSAQQLESYRNLLQQQIETQRRVMQVINPQGQ